MWSSRPNTLLDVQALGNVRVWRSCSRDLWLATLSTGYHLVRTDWLEKCKYMNSGMMVMGSNTTSNKWFLLAKSQLKCDFIIIVWWKLKVSCIMSSLYHLDNWQIWSGLAGCKQMKEAIMPYSWVTTIPAKGNKSRCIEVAIWINWLGIGRRKKHQECAWTRVRILNHAKYHSLCALRFTQWTVKWKW